VKVPAVPKSVTQDNIEVSRLPLRLQIHSSDKEKELYHKCLTLIGMKNYGKCNLDYKDANPNEFGRLEEDLLWYVQSVYYADREEHAEETFREFAERFYGRSISPRPKTLDMHKRFGPKSIHHISGICGQATSSPSIMEWRQQYGGVHAAAAIVTESHHLYEYDHAKRTYEKASTCILVDAYGCTHSTLDSTFIHLISYIVDTNAIRVNEI